MYWYSHVDNQVCKNVMGTNFFFNLAQITLAPQAGHVLGGTAVRVAGACLEATDTITCIFHDTEVEGIYVNERVAICVSPHIQQIGRVSFQLIVRNETGTIRTQGRADFFLRELIHILTMFPQR